MTIKEVEKLTGLKRSNIRFYEKEKLIAPLREKENGYRDYSEKDVEEIKKIAYLRTLGMSIEDIRQLIVKEISLKEVLENQHGQLREQIVDLNRARILCEKMLESDNISYDELHIEQYVEEFHDYWQDNQPVFRLDSVSFLYLWSSHTIWMLITILCLAIAALSYTGLPLMIPVQWNQGVAVSFVSRNFIFAYPAACIMIHVLLRHYLHIKLEYHRHSQMFAEYISNYMCFVVLSVEAFSILFMYGVMKSIVAVLIVDTAILIGLLVVGIVRLDLKGEKL